MRALVCHGPRDFRLEQRPVPVPVAGEVLLRPLFNGICFTDKHVYEGHVARAPGRVIGHEFSARIEALGPGVGDWRTGELVCVEPRLRCGQCLPCRAGLETLCAEGGFIGVDGGDGGLAEFVAVPSYSLYRLPQGCSPLQASCVEAACCATRAVRSGCIVFGDNVVLLGIEDYNLYIAQWLRGAGTTVVAVDPLEHRRSAALQFGAQHAIDPLQGHVASAIRAIMPLGADVVVVALEDYLPAAEQYVALAHRIARIQGRIIMLRAYGSASFAKVQSSHAWLKELTIHHFGNFFGNEPARGGRARGDWQVTLEAMARGTLAAPPAGTVVRSFASLRGHVDIESLFGALPGQASKLIVDMTPPA
jgi:threonine dehydrogenase-like Zn-dependent dehydrogenase